MASILKRGEIYWAELNPTIGHEQAGLRPVVIVSHDIFNKSSGTVIAMAITSQQPKAAFPLTYEINSNKLPKKSWVKISQIRTISIKRLQKKICALPTKEIEVIVEGLSELLSS